MDQTITRELLAFIEQSPSVFHVIRTVEGMLDKAGFKQLKENQKWELTPGGKYYVARNSSSLIAFAVPEKDWERFSIGCAHSDSPGFKIKENPEIAAEGCYTKLNVERYGGMLCAPWFDRPLSIAGRIFVQGENGVQQVLVDAGRDLVMIPSLAIHMNREVNEGTKYNVQQDMLPLYGDETAKGGFWRQIARAAGLETGNGGSRPEDYGILGTDLFLYCRTPGSIWGASEEYVSAPHLDDLQCAFALLKGFIGAGQPSGLPVYALFDNEEVGSTTRQGAASTFLSDTLERICLALGKGREQYLMAISESLMVSADNAHAVHPSAGAKADPVNRPRMNQGIVLKYNADQKYTTDGGTAAAFKSLCIQADAPYQTFTNRSDMRGGSTLGNISNTQVSLPTVDIGLPQLAMHSPYETAGVRDTAYLVRVMEAFFGR